MSASVPAPAGRATRPCSAQVAARRLGIAAGAVRVTSGNSDRDVPGFGAVGLALGHDVGGAVAATADAVIDKGKRVAAHAACRRHEAEIDYRRRQVHRAGIGREVSLFEVAERAAELKRRA